MVWIDNIDELEYFHANPLWPCYADPVFTPHDILLQAQYSSPIDPFLTNTITVNILKPDGTFIEDGSAYFDRGFYNFVLDGVTYNYSNIRCDRYSPGMLSNGCFVLEVIISDSGGTTRFHKYTQKYNINNTVEVAMGVFVIPVGDSDNIATLCGLPAVTDSCGKTYIELLAQFDCIDTFTGDYYGNGNYLAGEGNNPFNFVRKCQIEGRIRKVPKAIKTTISINCRTQRTETTEKYLLSGTAQGGFPVWKMSEIEGMFLSNHIFIDAKEYKTEGGTFFKQFGKPQGCNYRYQLEASMQGCFEWQIFGCTPLCDAQTYYYPINF